MLKKEVFSKFIKLLSAGLIPVNAKKLQGLELKELISLPLEGTQVLNLESLATKIITPESIPTNIFLQFEKFMELIRTIEKDKEYQLDKNPIVYNYCLILKKSQLIKDGCIIDTSTKEFIYHLDMVNAIISETPLIELETILIELIKTAYINDLVESKFTNYPVLNLIKIETFALLNKTDYIDNNTEPLTNQEILDQWFNNLFTNMDIHISFEFKLDTFDALGQQPFDTLWPNGLTPPII